MLLLSSILIGYLVARDLLGTLGIPTVSMLIAATGGILLVLIGLNNIDILLGCLVFSFPFTTIAINVPALSYGILAADILSITLVLLLLGERIVGKQVHKSVTMNRASWGLILFIVVVLGSMVMSAWVPVSEYGGEVRWVKSIKQFLKLLLIVAPYFVVLSRGGTMQLFEKYIRWLVISGFVVSLYAMYQIVGTRFHLDLPLLSFGRNITMGEGARELIVSFYGLPRVHSFLSEPDNFGSYLLMGLPLLIAARMKGVELSGRFFDVFSLLLTFFVFVFTFSRSPYFGLLVSVLALLWVLRSYSVHSLWTNRGIVVGLVLICFIAATIAPSADSGGRSWMEILVGRMLSAFDMRHDSSTWERWTMLGTSINMLRAFPVLGVGFGNFGFHYPLFEPDWGWTIFDVSGRFASAQSMFVRILAETGILGTLTYFFFTFYTVKLAIRSATVLKKAKAKLVARRLLVFQAGLLAAFVGISVSLFLSSAELGTHYYFFVAAMIVLGSKLSEDLVNNVPASSAQQCGSIPPKGDRP